MAKSRKKEELVEEEILEEEEFEEEEYDDEEEYEEYEDDDDDDEYEEVEYDSKLEEFIDTRRNLLLGIAVVILLAAAGIYYWNSQRTAKSESAREVMYKAVQFFETDSLNKALNGDGLYPGFLEIESTYSGTREANLAKYYIGVIHVRQGNLDEGIQYLKEFDKSNTLLGVSAYTALGYAHEDTGDPNAAADYFEKAANAVKDNEFTTPTMLMQAARNYELAGNTSKAKSLYERIKEDYPNSTEGLTIDKYIGRVTE